jgi:ubiquinone biosynthesis protein Coq4
MRGAANACGGPTDEQSALVAAIGTHVLGIEPEEVDPLPPMAAAEQLGGAADCRLAAEAVVLMEFARHPASEVALAVTEEYLAALDESDDFADLVRDQAHRAREDAARDLARLLGSSRSEPGIAGATVEQLQRRLEALRACAPGTLGHAFVEFYDSNGFEWPLASPSLVHHDFDHVLAGYGTTAEGELALQAMLVGADSRHFPGLLASLLLYEAGLVPFGDIEPTEAALARPGAAELFADALRRGGRCATDFSAVDHFASVERDLAELRAELGIDPPPPGPFTLDF